MIQPTHRPHASRANKNFTGKVEAHERAQREAWWLNLWQTRNWRTMLLWPLSVVYATVAVVRRLAANDSFARRMLAHLKEEGVTSLEQLPDLPQGYVTKVLHTLTHLLDGFIGIDSVFYNLVEDSHRISTELMASLRTAPANYWLVPVRTGKLEASVLHPVD